MNTKNILLGLLGVILVVLIVGSLFSRSSSNYRNSGKDNSSYKSTEKYKTIATNDGIALSSNPEDVKTAELATLRAQTAYSKGGVKENNNY